MAARTFRFLLSVMAVVCTGSAAPAQPARGRGPGAVIVEQMSLALEGLNLTAEQRAKVDPILATARTDARGMMQELAQADAPTRRGRQRAFMDDLRNKIVPVLTTDQTRSFDQRLADLRGSSNLPGALAGQRPVGQVIEQLHDFVFQLELDEQQKPKLTQLFTDTRQKLMTLRQNPPGDGTMPQKVQAIVQELREQLFTTLNESQQQQLRQMIAQGDAAPGGEAPMARGGRRGRGRGMPPDMPAADMMNPAAAAPAVARPTEPDPADLPGVPIGDPAPDFTLNNLEGRPLSLASYKGKVVLIVFGSYSSPSFRQRAAGLEQLRNTYNTRINVVVVYTKESYPVGEWDTARNKDEGIAIEQAKDMPARIEEAKKARTALHLTAPFLVDTMENTVATTYGGFTNSAVLIGRDGKVLHRQKWFEPYAVRKYIDDALK